VQVQGLSLSNPTSEAVVDDAEWVDLVAPSRPGPDAEHEYEALVKNKVFSHVKLIIIPDGGVKRIRVFGKRR
jgi:allantoicase